jgi:PhnB protein
MAKPIRDGFHTATPYLTVKGAARALEFYKRAFGAHETDRMTNPDGTSVMHAELRIGDSMLMLCDEFPQPGAGRSPESLGGTTSAVFLYVPDVDAAFKRAIDAGAKAVMPPTDMFWGDRFAKLTDPFGHQWAMATHKEDLSREEIQKRGAAAMAAMANQKA